jgi:hypothetical protein
MNRPSTSQEHLRRALTTPSRGVLGLVDDLLTVSRGEQGLRLAWQTDHCRVRFLGQGPEEWIEVPLRKSVVRAALARVAVLCNERNPNSVSPYGGQGEQSVGTDPVTVFCVVFANTPDEQSLELVRVSPGEVVDDGGQPAHGTVRTALGIMGEEAARGDPNAK